MIVIVCPCCDSNNINIIINKNSNKKYFKCIVYGNEFGKNQAVYEER